MNENITADVIRKVYGSGARRYEEVMMQYWEFDRQKLIDSLELDDGQKVLEVGVGTGKNLPHYPEKTIIVGIDLTPEMLQVANEKQAALTDRNITLTEMDAEQMSFQDNEYDAALESFVLCVVPNPEHALKEIIRVTKPGAKIAIFDYCRSKEADTLKWQQLIAPSARTVGFPPGVIVWDPLRDYEQIIRQAKLPLKVESIELYENPNPFLLACSMVIENVKGG